MPGAKKNYDGSQWPVLRKLWKEANVYKNKCDADKECTLFWNQHKYNQEEINSKIVHLNLKIKANRSCNPLLNAFQRASTKSNDAQVNKHSEMSDDEVLASNCNSYQPDPGHIQSATEEIVEMEPALKTNPAPKQNEIQNEIDKLQIEELLLRQLKDKVGLGKEQVDRLKTVAEEVKIKQKALKRLISNRKSQQKLREKRQSNFRKLIAENPQLANQLAEFTPTSTTGRPPLEKEQPGLLKAIIDAVSSEATADERRRSEVLRSCKTLHSLLEALKIQGYCLSRSALYLRLEPRRRNCDSGRRHVTTVPVKLARAQNTFRKKHVDSHFAAAQVRHVKDLAELYGEDNVIMISQDDKAKVPLGIAAAKLQGPILMRVNYRVMLPDHDWVVGSRHKLTPSVYAGLVFKDKRLSYSGPTYIAIRSGKHDSSTAASHAVDLQKMFNIKALNYFTRREGQLKPILIVTVDGGPDQNPHFPKTLAQAMNNFVAYNFDAVFYISHAPHQSASNPVERRMAPLSKQLSGVILPYDHYGSHLDASHKTVDFALEKQNFGRAGIVLEQLWDGMIIDGHRVYAEYIPPPGDEGTKSTTVLTDDLSLIPLDESLGTDTNEVGTGTIDSANKTFHYDFTETWKATHVRQSQYLIQIVKCKNRHCCGTPQTNLSSFLPLGFLPPPVLYDVGASGINCALPENKNGHYFDLFKRMSLEFLKIPSAPKPLPNDYYCPSVTKKISDLICKSCGLYFVTKSSLKQHSSVHTNKPITNVPTATNGQDSEPEVVVESEDIFIIEDIDMWWASEFVEDSGNKISD